MIFAIVRASDGTYVLLNGQDVSEVAGLLLMALGLAIGCAISTVAGWRSELNFMKRRDQMLEEERRKYRKS